MDSVTGLGTLFTFLSLLAANYLIIYLVVSAVLTNSGVKADIKSLQDEVSSLKKLLDEKTKSISDGSDKDS